MINWIFLSAGCLLSLVLGLMIIPKILLISYKKRLFDLPDSRKVHQVPVPRLGGISFFPVILISSCFILGVRVSTGFPIVELPAHEFLFFTVGGMMLFLIGVADDLIGVGYRYKFLVQIIAAFLIVCPGEWLNTLGGLFGIYELPVALGVLFTLFVVVYITNAINLIDGIDGLASGLSCIALSVLGIICMVEGDEIYAQLAFATLGVIVPFWFYNVFGNAKRGHKLFMGDTGSLILGYIISLLVIHLSRNDMSEANEVAHSHMVLAFSTLIVPLFDVVRVVIHRLREGKSPFLPDKNHFHHKLLRTGMRPRQVMVTILFIALFFIGINGLLADVLNITILLMLDIVLWTLMQLGINRAIRRRKTTS
ncbi:MAG: undecaprenyl/decaprenyl-phosphate alpha-N-acetylglucosaminyl 1-phosphate transferase [Candidatus Bacteroides intestinipullorum]|uniref:Undecaprenyl/decaprenyl-phosphate alpha-N-acetylglucosaminyl 1-phosphate transferase n=1 Tax=Candidatus Bacteroides intestinipullorum TaxID=2838471 RepID=A0A9E2KG79_9BACE|nr:undecaprenyl/decaprenyl-phosphate alpha-N-acetylglucosaminyl 1-phosphate transferase [Candidatus Bacteroides intestinipullorum]